MEEKWFTEKLCELFNLLDPPKDKRVATEDWLLSIIKEIEDKYWAQEQYYLDTIKTLKEGKPKVSRNQILELIAFIAGVEIELIAFIAGVDIAKWSSAYLDATVEGIKIKMNKIGVEVEE